MHPIPLPPAPKPWVTDANPEPRAGELLLLFAELQEQRDDHAEQCHGRELPVNPCARLWELDQSLRALWAELARRGADDLATLYGLRP